MGVKLKFYGTEETKTENQSLEIFANQSKEITLIINDEDVDLVLNKQIISLDKQTAIRLSRELRKQIALLD
jgi:hypothetical protein